MFSAPAGVTPSEFCKKMFDAGKTRIIALPYGEKTMMIYVKPFLSDTGTSRTDRQTDRQTDRFAISISRVNVLTRDKNCQGLSKNCFSFELLMRSVIKIYESFKCSEAVVTVAIKLK